VTIERDDARLAPLSAMFRDEVPPPLPEPTRKRMLAAAKLQRRRPAAPVRSPIAWLAAAAVLLAALGGTTYALLDRAADAPSIVSLTTGDDIAVSASAGSTFELGGPDDAHVAILEQGVMLFDVLPGRARPDVAVKTPTVVVRVTGTVFSVAVEDGRTRVDVFEGSVRVERTDGQVDLEAGGVYSEAAIPEVELPEAIAELGRRAAARRHRAERRAERDARDEPPTSETAPVTEAPATIAPLPNETVPNETVPNEAVLNEAEPRIADTAEAPAVALEPPPESQPDPADPLAEGDRHRAEGRVPDAIAAYEAVVRTSDAPATVVQAGYLAAWLRWSRLDDAAGAIAILDRSRADGPSSPLAERALVLRVRAQEQRGRTAEAAQAAAEYLARFPHGGERAAMEAIAR
jgi:hypothetical protein